MKKLLLSFAAAFAFVAASATSVTFDFTTNAYGLPEWTEELGNNTPYVETPATITQDKVSIKLEGGWRMWSDGLREYYKTAGTSFTVSVEGENVRGVEWTVVTGATFALEGTDANITSWAGDAASVTFVNTSSANKAVKTITVTYGEDVVVPDEPETPDTPDAPTGTISVAKALALIADGYNGEATVTGYIYSISEISTQYGNATYIIKDELSDDEDGLTVFRGKWFNGENFTSENQLETGKTVTVTGTLVDYNGTPEFTTGSKIVEYDGQTSAPDTPDVPDTPDTPDTPEGDYVTFNFTDLASLDPAQTPEAEATEIDATDITFTAGCITLTGSASEEASTKPRLYYGTSKGVSSWSYRFYKDNTITIASTDECKITAIVFNGSNLTNASITWSAGEINGTTWTAPEDGVSELVINKTESGNNPIIYDMNVYYTSSSSIVESVAIENAPVEYFNLQGVRVANPENGLYIRRQGNTVSKVLVK